MTSKITEFYNNTNILITGGTGFLGKILIQKLLRECTGIEGIYIVTRGKNGKDINTRIEEMFQDVVFDKLKKHNERFMEKIFVVEGDCSKLDLALSEDNKKTLIEKVNIVFHMAASANMNEKMRKAVEINVLGTRELIKLCKKMICLKSAVYVSTAYSNCNKFTIEEKIYKSIVAGETLIQLAKQFKEKKIDMATEPLLDYIKFPNTYFFTKCVSENLISKHGEGLPWAIFRPSIVQPTYTDPMPGWTDNAFGPTGMGLALIHGLMRIMYCKSNVHFDTIPADYCANALITSAWDLKTKIADKSNETIPIYNYTAGLERSLTWHEFAKKSKMIGEAKPMSNTLWPVHYFQTTNRYLYYLCIVIFHYLPAILMDIYYILVRKEPKMVQIYNSLHKINNTFEYCGMKEFNFNSNNVQSMWKSLNEIDKNTFPFDLRGLDRDHYFKNMCYGLKYYFVNDNKSDVENDIRRYKKLKYIEKILCIIVIVGMIYFLFQSLIVPSTNM